MSVEGVLKGGIEPLLERMFDVVFEEAPLADGTVQHPSVCHGDVPHA